MNDTSNEQPAAGAVDNDLDRGTWYQAACSGLWYRKPGAAGEVVAIRANGRTYRLSREDTERIAQAGRGAAAAVLDDARDERGTRSMQRVGRLRSLRARIAALKKALDKPMTALRRARDMSDLARAERELSDLEAQPTH